MKSLQRSIPIILLLLVPVFTYAQESSRLKGVWELVSQKINGKDSPISGIQIKLLAGSHFMWIHQDKKQNEELLAKGTQRDSISAYRNIFGAGTYKVTGDTYTETTEIFYEPRYIGTSIDFKFKLDGDNWYTAGRYSHSSNRDKAGETLLEQVWKRIEE